MNSTPPTEDAVPVELSREGDSTINIRWSDGMESSWSIRELRDGCPCATCREKRRADAAEDSSPNDTRPQLPILSAAEAQPLRIEGMTPVGTYAYNISFSDGHSSGLFTFPFLRRENYEEED